jgi:hypothetical protein
MSRITLGTTYKTKLLTELSPFPNVYQTDNDVSLQFQDYSSLAAKPHLWKSLYDNNWQQL